ncbi:MAG: tRNA adenosine(34) deaminase TadA [Christensenellaceae bacterium]|jgi:tRNA(adenine34) deaminase|nr:tRNA adenosine(34) deaminase TadA [Christensenellaceae bacterium]
MSDDKIRFMEIAIEQAKKAAVIDEVPVGAIIVLNGEIIARAFNHKETKHDPTAHAEIEAIRKATRKLRNWHLDGADMYVTLEPCPMCAGAIINARLQRLYFGAYDPKGGCCGSLLNIPNDIRFNHRTSVEGGILEETCAAQLSNFFKAKRKNSNRES